MKPMTRAFPITLMMVVCLSSFPGCAEKIEAVERIIAVSGTIGKPAQGELVSVPVDAPRSPPATAGSARLSIRSRTCPVLASIPPASTSMAAL